ncbi:excinuclease ABC subunit UvrC [Patescibacteria group bacterium]|nr:MAG: excinuclease ABC subunit UvrC [Patescibacteria group bacterium]
MTDALRNELKTLPSEPGVYFHKSESGEIIYVGKAASLRNRVRQYFQKSRLRDAKTDALVAEITDTDWVTVETELDALFLESEMIKRYMPRYNVLLRDDKSLSYVRIPMNEAYPAITFTRSPLDDSATYFGPYYNGHAVKKALRYLRRVFPYSIHETMPKRLCLQYHIGLCPGVEEQKISSSDYKVVLRKLMRYLRGERKALMDEIERDMKRLAVEHDFEGAVVLRNRLRSLKELQRQIVFGDREFMDISKDQALVGLKELLALPDIPRRIEAYDISHMSGTNNVASMVVATKGLADKSQYRKFKMQLPGNNDTGHMRETVKRRLKHLKDWGRPDLIVIDGGIPQLSAVADVLRAENIPFVGRNKSGYHGKNSRVRLVVPRGGVYEAIELEKNSHIAKLISRLDDESHRFAVSYHTTLKRQGATKSILDDIPGVGPATRKKLVASFGSGQGVKQANLEQLMAVLGERQAATIFDWFHSGAVD